MTLETHIRRSLNARVYRGRMEIKNKHGRIDILTPDTIIEIKEASKYKHAVGQLLAYKELYPNHKMLLILFGWREQLFKYLPPCLEYTNNYNIENKQVIVECLFEGISF